MQRLVKTLVLLGGLAGAVFGQKAPAAAILTDKESLRGHIAMAVEIDMASIPGADLRPEIENKLQQGGITILRATADPRTYPILRIGIDGATIQRLQQLNYHIVLEFIQLFSSADGKYMQAASWSSHQSGFTPWTNAFSSAQPALAEIERDVMSALNGFLQSWGEANGRLRPQAAPVAACSGLFNGTWQGTYSCNGGSSGGQTVWVIREVRPGVAEVQEQWTHFITGRNNYTGTIADNSLDVKTRDMGGYEVKLSLSADNATLRGKYFGHPNYCETVTLRKTR